jgi:hypothetical protein
LIVELAIRPIEKRMEEIRTVWGYGAESTSRTQRQQEWAIA